MNPRWVLLPAVLGWFVVMVFRLVTDDSLFKILMALLTFLFLGFCYAAFLELELKDERKKNRKVDRSQGDR